MLPSILAPRDPYTVAGDFLTEIRLLRAQIIDLNERVSALQVENRLLRARTSSDDVPSAAQIYATPSENAVALPSVVEKLAVMQLHFYRQGTLKKCSAAGCNKNAFEQTCFRLGHMAWCQTHNRVITGTYTSCSVAAEDRGDCVPVWWEQRHDWQSIVDRAYQEGEIGHKGINRDQLDHFLFSPAHNPLIAPGNIFPMGDVPGVVG